MKQLCQGSALLLSVILLSGLTIICMLAWRATTYSYICGTEKQVCIQSNLNLQSLQNYAIALCKADMQNLYQHIEMNDRLVLEFDHWPTAKSKQRGVLVFDRPQKKGDYYLMHITAKVEPNHERPRILACTIYAQKLLQTFKLEIKDTLYY